MRHALAAAARDRTTFVIAHRFSTILDADRIAVLEGGRLTALGTHAEVLERSAYYTALVHQQAILVPAGE